MNTEFDFHATPSVDLVELLDEVTAVWPKNPPARVQVEIAALRTELHDRYERTAA
jgi:hypothetical protein